MVHRPMSQAPPRLPIRSKLALTRRIWAAYRVVSADVRRHPVPQVVERLGPPVAVAPIRVQPKRLGHVVGRVLRIGPWRPRCLFTSLVLYRLLLEQGDPPEFVIGLPHEPRSKDAHAWVELDGVDVGPPPGGRGHVALARYGPPSAPR
jgi:hypothetical protein